MTPMRGSTTSMTVRCEDAFRAGAGFALVAAIWLSACGQSADRSRDDAEKRHGQERHGSTSAGKTRQTRTENRRRSVAAAHRDETVRTTNSGVVVAEPAAPKATATRPESNCGRQKLGAKNNQQGATILIPPAPGIRARRAGPHVVEVVWRFGRLPARCRPTRLRFAVDVSDDGLPGRQTVTKVSGRYGTKRLRVPSDLGGADVVRAEALTAKTSQSRTASVVIQ
jgi:hypothetical protein